MSDQKLAIDQPKPAQEPSTRKPLPSDKQPWETPEDGGRLRRSDGPAVHPLHLRLPHPLRGRSVDEYRAPLFIAWQLTNRCRARCLACCEESGPDKAWRDELIARRSAAPRARHRRGRAFPTWPSAAASRSASPHAWEVFEILAAAGVSLKLETEGSYIDDAAADRLAALPVQCVQISVDGATAATHERDASRGELRLGHRPRSAGSRAAACKPQLVFVPTRINLGEIADAYELAGALGCDTFVTGPLMRLGRAAQRLGAPGALAGGLDAGGGSGCASGRAPGRRALDLPLGHRHRDAHAPGEPAGDAAGGAEREGEAAERAALRARGPAARLAGGGVDGLPRRVAQRRRAGLRRALRGATRSCCATPTRPGPWPPEGGPAGSHFSEATHFASAFLSSSLALTMPCFFASFRDARIAASPLARGILEAGADLLGTGHVVAGEAATLLGELLRGLGQPHADESGDGRKGSDGRGNCSVSPHGFLRGSWRFGELWSHFLGAAAGGGGMSTTFTVGLKRGSRTASCPWREKSIDSPRMRAPSCGAWKPVEFSASTKSR